MDDSKETNKEEQEQDPTSFYNGEFCVPTPTRRQAKPRRPTVGLLSPRKVDQIPLGPDGSPSSVVANQEPSMQLGNEQRPRKYAPDSDGNSSGPSGPPAKETMHKDEQPPHDETPTGFYYRDATTFWVPPSTSQGLLWPRQLQQPLGPNGRGENSNLSGPLGPPARRGRGRGRPRGSVNKPREGGTRSSFTPHIIEVNTGEDIATKVEEFMNQEPSEFCIISASGAISSVAFQSFTPSGVVKYEGQYGIIKMSGSFLNTESSNGTVTRPGNLSVLLAGPNGKTVGGCVGGMLVAGSQAQVVVGCFVREKVEQKHEPASAPANVLTPEPASSEENDSNNNHQAGKSMYQYHYLWPGNNHQ